MSEPLDAEDFYDLTLVSTPAVSPSGDRVAFVANEFDREADERRTSLFVAPTDGSRDPHRLTRVADAGDPAWSPDGSKLAFRAARETDVEIEVTRDDGEDEQPEGGGEEAEKTEDDDSEQTDDEPKPQIWAFDLDRGGDARQITDFEEGAKRFDWGPEGDRLVVAARDPTDDQREYLDARREDDAPVVTERLQHKYDGQGWLDEVRTYLFVVEYESREATRLDDAYGGGVREPITGLDPAWSPAPVAGTGSEDSGEHRIAFLSNRTERPDDNYVMDVYTIAPDGSDCRKVTDSDLTAAQLRWHPAGDRLAFVGGDPENAHVPSKPYVADFSGGVQGDADAPTVHSWASDLDRTVARFGRPAWDGDDLLAPIGDEGLTRLARFRADDPPERTFDAQGRDRTVVGFDYRAGTAAVVLSDPEEGWELHAVEAGAFDAHDQTTDAEPTRLTAATRDLVADHRMPECRRFTVESDGHEIETIAYLPDDFDTASPDGDGTDSGAANSDADPRPLVVSVHGGPVAYDAPEFKFLYAYLAGQGYVVLRPNYRGSSSYGRAFSETIRGDWGPRETADVLACVDEAVERGWADPDRLFATGFSYGGITTAYLAAETDRFAAAAAEHGVYDFRAAFGTDDSHVWWTNDFGVPWENPERYDAAGSIADVGEMDTPMLVTAGGEDWRCPPSQSEQLYVSLKKQGVPARLVVYPDEHHAIGDPDRAIHRLEQLTDWFERFDPEKEENATGE